MGTTTELYLLMAAVVALSAGIAVVATLLAPDAARLVRCAWSRAKARRRARRDIQQLARRAVFLAGSAERAVARGHFAKATLYRRGAADSAKFAFRLSQLYFPSPRPFFLSAPARLSAIAHLAIRIAAEELVRRPHRGRAAEGGQMKVEIHSGRPIRVKRTAVSGRQVVTLLVDEAGTEGLEPAAAVDAHLPEGFVRLDREGSAARDGEADD